MSIHCKNTVFKTGVISPAFAILLVLHAVAGSPLKQGEAIPDVVKAGLASNVPNAKGKVILLDFWASWCGPCKKPFPVMEKIYQDYKDRGLIVVGISVDENADKMKAFLEKQKIAFPVFRDIDQKLVAAAGIAAMPTSFLLDADGNILSVHKGFKAESYEKELRREIEKHLPKAGGKQK